MKTLFNGTDVILIETTNFFIMLQEEGNYVLSKTVDKKMGEERSTLPRICTLIYEDKSRCLYKDKTYLYEVIDNRTIIRHTI